MSDHKRREAGLPATKPQPIALATEVPVNSQVLWPGWVLNGIGERIYRARFTSAEYPEWDRVREQVREDHRTMARAALQWIEAQGWVKMPTQGEGESNA